MNFLSGSGISKILSNNKCSLIGDPIQSTVKPLDFNNSIVRLGLGSLEGSLKHIINASG